MGLTNCSIGEKVRKGAFAPAVEKSRNRKPSPQALRTMDGDRLEKKFEKVPPQSHSLRVLKFTIISNGLRSVNTSFAEFISKFGNTNAIILLFSAVFELLKRSCAFEANSRGIRATLTTRIICINMLINLVTSPPNFVINIRFFRQPLHAIKNNSSYLRGYLRAFAPTLNF